MITREDVSSFIVEAVLSAPASSLTGGQLASALRRRFENFSLTTLGSRSIREFIRTAVPGISEVGNSGADVRYGLRASVADVSVPSEADERPLKGQAAVSGLPSVVGHAWRAFTNPGFESRLFANTHDGQLKASTAKPGPDSLWVEIPKVSSEKHKAIARAFVESLPLEPRRTFEERLGSDKWFVSFGLEVAKAGFGTQWSNFKRRELQKLLQASLEASGIQIRSTEAASPSKQIANSSLSPRADVRRLVLGVIQKLSEEDLRSLRLPLGDVLDALKEQD